MSMLLNLYNSPTKSHNAIDTILPTFLYTSGESSDEKKRFLNILRICQKMTKLIERPFHSHLEIIK